MRTIDSAENWPGFSELLCEVKGTVPKWSQSVSKVVVKTLKGQYYDLGLELPVGFERLENPNVNTVTTGHQLQLFGGPAFLHYKTITAIRKAKELSNSDHPVVPVFWMASEDHDFEEIRWVYGKSEKHSWQFDSNLQMVGRLGLDGLQDAFNGWVSDGLSDMSDLQSVLSDSIKNGESYAQFFTRFMHLFYSDTGLVVIDASHENLKCLFASEMQSELEQEGIALEVLEGPVKPREINLFYSAENGSRIGVIPSSDGPISNGEYVSSETPQNLSPSVLLRPLYQEKILPNSHVILGPSEIKYWQQLTPAFKKRGINFPTLFLRDHVLVIEDEDFSLLKTLGWSLQKGWWSDDDFVRVLMDEEMVRGFGIRLEDLNDDDTLIGVLEKMKIEFGQELADEDAPFRIKAKIRKTAIKKVKRHLKNHLKSEISNVIKANGKLMKGMIPQDRWGNFHVLSESVGGFKSLRDKLLETTDVKGPVIQVIAAS